MIQLSENTNLLKPNTRAYHVNGWIAILMFTSLQLSVGVIFSIIFIACYERSSRKIINRVMRCARVGLCADLPLRQAVYWHAIGSFTTNLAFFYGSATLVQVFKLLEPCLVMIVSRSISRMSASDAPLVPYMPVLIIAVGAGILITTTKKFNEKSDRMSMSMAVSLCSALALSLRNVFLKNSFSFKRRKESEISSESITCRSFAQCFHGEAEKFGFMCASGLFILLSFTLPIIFPLFVFMASSGTDEILGVLRKVLIPMSVKDIAMHSCYNFLSILTLGSVSVVTHSLLGVFKRIFSILFAAISFQERFAVSFKYGLALSLVGSVWYSMYSHLNVSKRMFLDTVGALSTVGVILFFTISSRANLVQEQHECTVSFKSSQMAFCHYVSGEKNFGDELGPVVSKYLLKRYFKCGTRHIPTFNLATRTDKVRRKSQSKVCFFTVGSVLHMTRAGDHVWGTGMNPYRQKFRPSRLNIHALRGKLTASSVSEVNHASAVKAAIGDPGLFISFFVSKDGDTRHHECFVPHAHDEKLARELYNGTIISVKNSWKEVTKAISACKFVASSSLHGLVVADALGIPSRWFQFSNGTKTRVTEGTFKYEDYFSAITDAGALRRQALDDIRQLAQSGVYDAPIPHEVMQGILENLNKSFPYHLFGTSSEAKKHFHLP